MNFNLKRLYKKKNLLRQVLRHIVTCSVVHDAFSPAFVSVVVKSGTTPQFVVLCRDATIPHQTLVLEWKYTLRPITVPVLGVH